MTAATVAVEGGIVGHMDVLSGLLGPGAFPDRMLRKLQPRVQEANARSWIETPDMRDLRRNGIPSCPRLHSRLRTLTGFSLNILVPFLLEPGRTVQALWNLATEKQRKIGNSTFRFPDFMFGEPYVRLAPRAHHPVGLAWSELNFQESDGGYTIRQASGGPLSVAFLAMLCHCPEMFELMNNQVLPDLITLGAYEVTIPGDQTDIGPFGWRFTISRFNRELALSRCSICD